MTISIISPPKHSSKAYVPVLSQVLALIALVLTLAVEFGQSLYTWERLHDKDVKRSIVLAVSMFTFGAVFALHLAGVR
jgi:hypothetical protein